MHFRAKQKMAEVKKLRQYYRKGDSSEERRKALQEKMRNIACHACGEIGIGPENAPRRAEDNGVLSRVVETGRWTLVDTPEAKALREVAAERKKRYNLVRRSAIGGVCRSGHIRRSYRGFNAPLAKGRRRISVIYFNFGGDAFV